MPRDAPVRRKLNRDVYTGLGKAPSILRLLGHFLIYQSIYQSVEFPVYMKVGRVGSSGGGEENVR